MVTDWPQYPIRKDRKSAMVMDSWSWLPSASESLLTKEGLRQRIKGERHAFAQTLKHVNSSSVNDETGSVVPLGCRMPFPCGEKNVDALLALQRSTI